MQGKIINTVTPEFGMRYSAKYRCCCNAVPTEATSFLPNFITNVLTNGIATKTAHA